MGIKTVFEKHVCEKNSLNNMKKPVSTKWHQIAILAIQFIFSFNSQNLGSRQALLLIFVCCKVVNIHQLVVQKRFCRFISENTVESEYMQNLPIIICNENTMLLKVLGYFSYNSQRVLAVFRRLHSVPRATTLNE